MADLGRILIADDDETFLQSTADLLRREGYECDCVPDAAKAERRLQEEQYDVLIADIRMPGNPELELIRELPNIAKGTPAILVTGYPSLRSAKEAVSLPVEGYLVKPLDFEELLRRVRTGIAHVRIYRTVRNIREQLHQRYEELGSVEELLKEEGRQRSSVPVDTFLELTFQNTVDAVSDLKHLTKILAEQTKEKELCHLFNCPRLDCLAKGLSETIEVLEESKRAFRSKSLGEMRRKLEELTSRKA